MGAGEEERLAVPGGGDSVAVAVRDAFDEPVVAETSQVVGRLPAGQGVEIAPEQGCEVVPEIAVGEPAGQQPEDAQDREQCLDPVVGEAHSGHALAGGGGDRVGDRGQDGGAVGGVVAESLDVEETSVG